jgi:hypothetical protein
MYLCMYAFVYFIYLFSHQFLTFYDAMSGHGRVGGIATHYGLDGPAIESRWGRDFSCPSRPASRPTQPPV